MKEMLNKVQLENPGLLEDFLYLYFFFPFAYEWPPNRCPSLNLTTFSSWSLPRCPPSMIVRG